MRIELQTADRDVVRSHNKVHECGREKIARAHSRP